MPSLEQQYRPVKENLGSQQEKKKKDSLAWVGPNLAVGPGQSPQGTTPRKVDSP